MANVDKYQVNGVSLAPPPYMGKGQSDTASPKSGRFQRSGTEARRKNQRQPRDYSKIFEGLQTLYG
jgi:hypothetical protein